MYCLIIFLQFYCFIQMFKETAEQVDAWLGTKEAFLANEDVGVCKIVLIVASGNSFKALKKPETYKIDLAQFHISEYYVKIKYQSILRNVLCLLFL